MLSAIVVLAAPAALAAPTVESTPIPAPPKPNFSSMQFLSGNWTCNTKSSRRPTAYVTTSSAKVDPTGYWMITTSTNHKTSWAMQSDATDKVTYDPSAHRWVDVFTDDQGNYDVTTSPGWKGNTIVWTDQLFVPSSDISSQTALTITKVSDSQIKGHSSFKETKSGRVVTVDSVCTKG
jgi:hypothetical protein